MIPALAFAAVFGATPQAYVDAFVRAECDVPGHSLSNYIVHDPISWGATVVVTMSGVGVDASGAFQWAGIIRVKIPNSPLPPPSKLQVNGH